MKDYKEEIREVKMCRDCLLCNTLIDYCKKYGEQIQDIYKKPKFCKVVKICIVIEVK